MKWHPTVDRYAEKATSSTSCQISTVLTIGDKDLKIAERIGRLQELYLRRSRSKDDDPVKIAFYTHTHRVGTKICHHIRSAPLSCCQCDSSRVSRLFNNAVSGGCINTDCS